MNQKSKWKRLAACTLSTEEFEQALAESYEEVLLADAGATQKEHISAAVNRQLRDTSSIQHLYI